MNLVEWMLYAAAVDLWVGDWRVLRDRNIVFPVAQIVDWGLQSTGAILQGQCHVEGN